MHGHRPDETQDVEPVPDDTTSRLAPRTIGNRPAPTHGAVGSVPPRPGPRAKGTLTVPVRRVGTVRVPLPEYQTDLAAGMDLVAAIEGPLTIAPFARVLVPTGIAMALPPGYEGQVRPRSGLAWSRGLTILNAPGTIDADYRGEIKVLLVNFSSDNAEVLPGERIAQLVVARHERIDLEVVESLDDTTRGAGGYGSTGV
jgi:dUTP pyrophosphatase